MTQTQPWPGPNVPKIDEGASIIIHSAPPRKPQTIGIQTQMRSLGETSANHQLPFIPFAPRLA
jgi:hypothetical protein